MRFYTLLLVVTASTAFVPPSITRSIRISMPHTAILLSSSSINYSRRPSASGGGNGTRRPRPVRIPPSNPEEVDAARRGEWNYEKGIIEKKEEEEINYLDY